MSTIFDEMDRLAAEKYAETPEATPDSRAAWGTTDYRYDLIPIPIILKLLNDHPAAHKFAVTLLGFMDGKQSSLLEDLADLIGVHVLDLAHFYAQVMHKVAIKCPVEMGTWEGELPESQLLNFALHNLFKLASGAKSKDHQAYLTWNVLTLILQRAMQRFDEQQNTSKETTNHDDLQP